jgi:hypothetical protein
MNNMDSLSERNFKAVQGAINILESRSQNTKTDIESLKVMVVQLSTQVAALTQQVAYLRATTLGTGPTVGA